MERINFVDKTTIENEDLSDFFLNLNKNDENIKYEGKDFTIYFEYINYEYDNEKFEYVSWGGILLRK